MPTGRSVFVVDDEPLICKTLVAILNHSGYQAAGFEDPTLAVEAARETSPDLLLTDVMMPRMNGIELAIHFHTFHPHCKVLLFSGMAATEDLLIEPRFKDYKFSFLTKPVHPSELLEKLIAL